MSIKKERIGFGCDHSGVALKHALMNHLNVQGYECIDSALQTAAGKMIFVRVS